jgi:hypothetical protein
MMFCPLPGEEYELGQEAAVGRFGQDAQPFGEEQPFLAPMFLVAQRADALDQRIGKGGDLAGQGGCPLTVILNLFQDPR